MKKVIVLLLLCGVLVGCSKISKCSINDLNEHWDKVSDSSTGGDD